MAFGNAAVATATGGRIIIELLTVTANPPLSATRVTHVFEPAAVGVPVIVQSLFSVSPAGVVPLATAHVYGSRPRRAVQRPEYGTFTSPPTATHVAVSAPRFTTSCSGRSAVLPVASRT